MSTSRRLPNTNAGRKSVMNTAVAKHKSVDPNDSVISAKISARLLADNTAFDDAVSKLESAEATEGVASRSMTDNRSLMHLYVNGYFKTLNNGIDMKYIPASARANYGLDITNKLLPDITTDIKLIHWANQVELGDAKRIADNGVVITMPLMADFVALHVSTKESFTNLSKAKSDLNTAQTVVNNLIPEVDNIILRTWNDVESTFSELPASNGRAASRPWSVLYVSVGKPAVITGKCTDGITGLSLPDAIIHLGNVTNKAISDAEGNYTLGTSLYGDMELIATLKDYKDVEITITMENGIDMVVNIIMTPL